MAPLATYVTVVAVVAALSAKGGSGAQHVLLDSTVEATLDWTRYPTGQNSSTPGWVEESFTNFEKNILWRSYVVCDVTYANVNNWLWTPFIQRGHSANRMYIEVKFSVRDCDLFPGNAVKCKETFTLLYYEFDAAAQEPPPWEPESYKLIDRIAADEGRFTNRNEMIINTETRSIEVTKKGVYFAFRDEGACLSILSVKVYYLTCSEITTGFARFPETATGAEISSIVKVRGQCVDHARPTDERQPPYYICNGEGSWVINTGSCSCLPGYEGDRGLQECRPCSPGHFKAEQGDGLCQICPPHSQALRPGSEVCECNPDYFRDPDSSSSDSKNHRAGGSASSACTKPPSAPRNPVYRMLDTRTVLIRWDPPEDEGGRSDTKYTVEETTGLADTITFSPPQGLPTSRNVVTVSNLSPGTTYKFRVLSTNGVSSISQRPANYVEITVAVTGGSEIQEGQIRPKVDRVDPLLGLVQLSWDLAPGNPGDSGGEEAYEVKYFEKGSRGNTTNVIVTKKNSIQVRELRPGLQYGFQVRSLAAAHSTSPSSGFGPAVYASTAGLEGEGDSLASGSRGDGGLRSGVDVTTIVGAAGDDSNDQVKRVAVGTGVAILLLVAAGCSLYFLVARRSSSSYSSALRSAGLGGGGSKDCCGDSLEPHFGSNTETLPIVQTVQQQTLMAGGSHPIYNPFQSGGGHHGVGTLLHGMKTYVDPHTYEDPQVAVKQFAKEIDSRRITIEAIIGGGEFGDVCRGRLASGLPPDNGGSSSLGSNDMLVAIKTLKPGSSEKARMDFLAEASIMGQFEHPNVIFLQGVVTKTQPIMIITEYMENGSLDTFLRANDGKFQIMQLVGMMRGIAYGMQYLSEMNYVHRDLAARNVLVNSQLVCKIADFGLSREVVADGANVDGGAYTTRGGKIPVRWTAPEAIAFRKFTSSSDVWSFGIVMWEVMSYGERPYWTWSNQDVIKAIEKGYRLPAPMDCPEAIHQLMLDCWQRERSHRPSFVSIVKTLDKLICCPDTLKKIANSPVHNPFSTNQPDYAALGGVDEWLASIKMSRYSENFKNHGITTLDAVAKLSLQRLTDIGITLVGHQKKVMGSIQAMRAQLSINMSEGFLV